MSRERPFVIHLSLENQRDFRPRKFLGKNPKVTGPLAQSHR
jgi:hypothetical protein